MQSRSLFRSFFMLFTLLHCAFADDEDDDKDFPKDQVTNIDDTNLTFDSGWNHWPHDGPPPGMTSNVKYNSVSWCTTGSNFLFNFRGSAVRIWSLTSPSNKGNMSCTVAGNTQPPVSFQGPDDQTQKALFKLTQLNPDQLTTMTCDLSNPDGADPKNSINVISIDIVDYQFSSGPIPDPSSRPTPPSANSPASTPGSTASSSQISKNTALSSASASSKSILVTSTLLATNTFTTTENGTVVIQTSTSSSIITTITSVITTLPNAPGDESQFSSHSGQPGGGGTSSSGTIDILPGTTSKAANISSSKSKAGTIAGAVIAVIAVIIAAIALLVWISRRRRRRILQTSEAINPYFAGESETPFPPSTPTPRIEEPTPIMQQRLYNTRASIASGFKSLIPSSTRHQRDRLAPLGINRHELNNNSTVRWLEDNWSSTEGSVVHDDSDEEEEKEDATRRQTGRTAFEHLSSRRSVGGGEFGAYAT